MALTGQLSDMSLAELIEFFCNQRKTGRLKIDYQRGHSVFFIKEGELVDAKVGALSGAEAVYFSLTLPNAAFDFSPDVQATRRTIEDPWTQVVLEGLRRLDEGNSPTEADAFGAWSPSETEFAQMLDQVDNLDAAKQQKVSAKKASAGSTRADAVDASSTTRPESQRENSAAAPFSMMVESASGGGSKKKFMLAGVAAAVLLACAVAAVPLLKRSAKGEPARATATAPQPESVAQTSPAATGETAAASEAASETPDATADTADASAAAADAARREASDRERRERERRERARKEDEAAKNEAAAADPAAAAAAAATAKPLAPAPAAPSGPKSVRVSVTYDEAGRVMQASVAGATPGAEAYGSTAVRIARGKHFPAGKPGSTVITIPVN
jgi:hypothetical protein